MSLFSISTKEKISKKETNKWKAFVNEVNLFTSNTKLKKVLLDYISFKNSAKNNKFYLPQCKCLLVALKELSSDTNEQIKIVEKSLQNGWMWFYPQHNYRQNKNNFGEFSGMSCSQDNDNEDVRGYF